MTNAKTILIVDDEIKIRKMYNRYLAEKGFNIIEASSAFDAYNILIKQNVDVVLLDINMPETNGEILYNITKLIHKKFKIIVSSVYPVDEQLEIIKGADDYFDKSNGLTKLVDKIENVMTTA